MQPRVWLPLATSIIFATTGIVRAADIVQEIATATQACQQDALAGNETARYTCAARLAVIADRFVTAYREHGSRNDEALHLVWAEMKKYPMPASSDSKKLTNLLVGKWNSPRRVYIFKPNGKYGSEGDSMDRTWKIQGNQLIESDGKGTLILLDSKYFIYTEGDQVFFHSRVK